MPANESFPHEMIASDAALEAARVCVWDWQEQSGRLRIRAPGSGSIPDIEGDWKLGDFLAMLDGLSQVALNAALSSSASNGKVEVTARLANGRELRLVGAHVGDGHAQGLVFGATIIPQEAEASRVEAVFQPIVHLKNGKIAGFEALARWRGDDGQLRRPGEMNHEGMAISGAGLAVEMLSQAGAALADWQSIYPDLNLFLQVNLTGADLFRADVIKRIEDLVGSGCLVPGSLKVELTEQMALRDFEAGVAAAIALQAAGAAVILDDFGSGHSSLAWLASIPATGIKIDPQLTQMVGHTRVDTILKGLAVIARQLDMSITAEGIEDLACVQSLRDIGCDYGQGFAYARPMTKADAGEFLKDRSGIAD